ncbi:METTL5 family protein [Nanoarchaeota archaeon]
MNLAIILSKLKVFTKAKVKEEQYATDSEIASNALNLVNMQNDIKGKIIADLGSGTGILGIGCLLLGAKKVHFVEKDKEAVEICKENLKSIGENFNIENNSIKNIDIKDFDEKVDVVIMNPPFGTKQKHADKEFLEKAFTLTKTIYSFHKKSTIDYIRELCERNNFKIKHKIDYKFPLKQTHKFHKSKIKRIDVSFIKIKK